MALWFRCYLYSLTLFCSAILAATEPDLFEMLQAKRKLLVIPTIQPPKPLTELKNSFASQEAWGLYVDTLSAEDRKAVNELFMQVLDPELIKTFLSAATDDQSAIGDMAAKQKALEDVSNLLELQETTFEPYLEVVDRPHVEGLHSVPKAHGSDWERMRSIEALQKDSAGYFAGRPLFDYCAADVGRVVPGTGAQQISVLDMAMAQATATQLDLSLLHLLEQPDPFAKLQFETQREDFSLVASDQVWSRVIRTWFALKQSASASLRSRFRLSSIFELSNGAGVLKSPAAMTFARNLQSVSQNLQAQCSTQKGKWREHTPVKRADKIVLLDCNLGTRAAIRGFELSVEQDQEFTELLAFSFEAHYNNISLAVRIDAERFQAPIEIKLSKDGVPRGSKLYYSVSGKPVAWVGAAASFRGYVWDEDGHLRWSGKIEESGHWTQDIVWDAEGQPVSEMSFDSNGSVVRLTQWYSRGGPARSVEFDKGKPAGAEIWWHVNGAKAGELNWDRGKKFGPAQLRFENGVQAFSGFYLEDLLDGPVTWRDEKEREVFRGTFRSGHPDGPLLIRSGDNVTLATAKFERGRAEGVVQIGLDAGRAGGTMPFKSGLLDGDVVFARSDGRKQMVIPYLAGRLHGQVHGFGADDKTALTCEFEEGRLVSWSVKGSDNSPTKFNIDGVVTDPRLGYGWMIVSDPQREREVHCKSTGNEWRDCVWKLKKKTYALRERQITLTQGKQSRNNKVCKPKTWTWNLSPLLEKNASLVFLKVRASRGCQTSDVWGCRVELDKELSVKACEPLLASEGSHEHQ